MSSDTTHRASILGFIWTVIWTIIHFAIFSCGLAALNGNEAKIDGMILTAKMKKGKLISYLIGGGGAIVFVELVILMTRKNFLDKKAYLKLLPILIGGAMIAAGEYYLEKVLLKGKVPFPLGWILHVIIYLCYLFLDVFRPWRPIKMLAGITV